MTVARLAVVRLVLLPLHSHWWAGQTSYSLYSALLLLYVLQIVNMLIYFNWPAHHIENHDTEVIWVVQERKVVVSLLLVTGYHTLFIFNSLLIHKNIILVIYPCFPAGFFVCGQNQHQQLTVTVYLSYYEFSFPCDGILPDVLRNS